MTTDEIRAYLNEYDEQREKLSEAIHQKNNNPDIFEARELVSLCWKTLQVMKESLILKIELL